jgi:cytochrome P450
MFIWYAGYDWMREEAPVCPGKISIMKMTLVSRYDDCKMVLSDPRFVRNRGRARGKGLSPLPFPMRVIAEMVGVSRDEAQEFARVMGTLTQGLTGIRGLSQVFVSQFVTALRPARCSGQQLAAR